MVLTFINRFCLASDTGLQLKKVGLLFLCLLLYVTGNAQPSARASLTDSIRTPIPAYVIKWAPFSVLDIDPTIQFALEYLLKGNWSLQQELGYGHFNYSNYTINGDDLWNKEVWRSRSEIRLYLGNPSRPSGGYTAFEVLYKRVNFNQEATLGRECEDGICNYFERVQYKVLRNVVGYHIKVGGQVLIEKRITADFYTGLGFRNIYVKTPGSGAEGEFREREPVMEIYPTRRGNYRLISMNLGFKVGYLIYRK